MRDPLHFPHTPMKRALLVVAALLAFAVGPALATAAPADPTTRDSVCRAKKKAKKSASKDAKQKGKGKKPQKPYGFEL